MSHSANVCRGPIVGCGWRVRDRRSARLPGNQGRLCAASLLHVLYTSSYLILERTLYMSIHVLYTSSHLILERTLYMSGKPPFYREDFNLPVTHLGGVSNPGLPDSSSGVTSSPGRPSSTGMKCMGSKSQTIRIQSLTCLLPAVEILTTHGSPQGLVILSVK